MAWSSSLAWSSSRLQPRFFNAVEQPGDVVDRQRTHPSGSERGQQMMLEVAAV
jgi:hypothetical protein